jgi:hypothetical protein
MTAKVTRESRSGEKLPIARPEAAPLPPVYLPHDIAEALHCSEWWVKEQARRGRIPFSKPGGRYLFTAEHFAEILRIFESRPADSGSTVTSAAPVRRRPTAQVAVPVTRLKARTPRRAQRNQSRSSAA